MLPFAEITRGIPPPPPAPAVNLASGVSARSERDAAADRARSFGGAGNASARPARFTPARTATTPPGVPRRGSGQQPRPPLARRGAPVPDRRRSHPRPIPAASGDSLSRERQRQQRRRAAASVGNVRRPTGIRLFSGAGHRGRDATRRSTPGPYSITGLPPVEARHEPARASPASPAVRSGFPGLMRTNTEPARCNSTATSNNSANTSVGARCRRCCSAPATSRRRSTASALRCSWSIRLTGLPFAGNAIPPDRISPQARALLALLPATADVAPPARSTTRFPRSQQQRQHNVQRQSIANLISNTTNQLGVNGGYNRSSNDSTSLFGFDRRVARLGDERRRQLVAPLHPVEPADPARVTPTRGRRIRPSRSSPTASTSRATRASPATTRSRRTGDRRACRSPAGSPGSPSGQYSLNRTQSHAFNVENARTHGPPQHDDRRRRPLPDDSTSCRSRTPRGGVHVQRRRSPDTTSPTSCSAFRTPARSRSAMPTRDSARGTTTRTSTTTSG